MYSYSSQRYAEVTKAVVSLSWGVTKISGKPSNTGPKYVLSPGAKWSKLCSTQNIPGGKEFTAVEYFASNFIYSTMQVAINQRDFTLFVSKY